MRPALAAIGADWGAEELRYALHKKGLSWKAVSRHAGLRGGNARKVCDLPWPRVELVVAELLEMRPEEIWPERWARRAKRQRMREAA
ncbi:helix-turn-helix domain-containing protein [Elioraea sp.]|uniref:helix-turn-helix domain-containing protein n=1 Tax=Elioraea sp. TaxID=2185103 RepID=UPI0025C1FB5A|nr:helix-turn-helix domain-containing protein [Elioraea sp.]